MARIDFSLDKTFDRVDVCDSIFKRKDEEYEFTPVEQNPTAISQLIISFDAYNGHRFESEGLLNNQEAEPCRHSSSPVQEERLAWENYFDSKFDFFEPEEWEKDFS